MSLPERQAAIADFENENRARKSNYNRKSWFANHEKRKASQRAYYRANRESILIKLRANYQRRKAAIRLKQNAYIRQFRAELKTEVLGHYSNGTYRCACCAESEPRFLTLDHVNGNGNQHRRETNTRGIGMYRLLKKQGYPGGFQVLCMNCNFAKSAYSICPHKRYEKKDTA